MGRSEKEAYWRPFKVLQRNGNRKCSYVLSSSSSTSISSSRSS